MSQTHGLLQAAVATHFGSDARIVDVRERDEGAQGYSGAAIRYYDVRYTQSGVAREVTLVTKDAPLVERRTLAWLNERGAAVPFSYSADMTTDAPALVCMQYVGDASPPQERVQQAARALASVHAAGMRRGDELGWLPRADRAFAQDFLIERCWRRGWRGALAGTGHVDAAGNHFGAPKPGGDFSALFASYTQPLEDAAERFLRELDELWQAGDSLTLIHADFHDDHARSYEGREYVIDWGFAHYGPLYIDLPNYFNREEALAYRDALAELGHDIPQEVFLAGYDAMRPYPGFKYFGIGLANWDYGDPPHQRQYVQHFIDMVL